MATDETSQPPKDRRAPTADFPKKYASSVDVARLAGVSQSAVSRTFKIGASVSPETRKKVLAAAEQLNYRPSLIPRIMLTHRSHLVAIVIGAMHNPFYAMVLEQFLVRLQKAGNQVLLVHVHSDYSLDAVIPRLASYRVDAIVSALSILSLESAEELARLQIPVVSFNSETTNAWVSSVRSDNRKAGEAIADLFIARGGRRFGYISGAKGSLASDERYNGYSQRLVTSGFEPPVVRAAGFRYERGFKAAQEMFSRSRPPDALFCANDLSAIGAMDALRQQGLRIPEDVIIAGFDDIPAAGWGSYELTTFLQDGARMVDETLRLIERYIDPDTPSTNGVSVVVPVQLIERATTQRSVSPVGD